MTGTLNEVDCPAAAIPYLAKSVQFCDNGNSVIVFYLESHEMYVDNSSFMVLDLINCPLASYITSIPLNSNGKQELTLECSYAPIMATQI